MNMRETKLVYTRIYQKYLKEEMSILWWIGLFKSWDECAIIVFLNKNI